MKNILPFSQLTRNDIPTAGGKGANLGELAAAGLPVPAGFVVTTTAYDAFIAHNGLQEQILSLANQISPIDPAAAEKASAEIGALFFQNEIPENLVTEITTAYEKLAGENGPAVAVRSSATAEDLPTASFAGQQESFLNVQGPTALLGAVKKCWSSLWTARAMAYRQRQGIDPAAVSLAVVVQALVPADAAGILFTANPVTGERDQSVINATWGLGEAIVGGLVTPDTVVVDRNSIDILERDTAVKERMTVRTEAGTAEETVPENKQQLPVLDDATAAELAQLGTRIETLYGQPMDIEWALANGEIAILQARPITSLPPEPLKNVVWEPPTPNTIWMRRQIVEHMPGPLSPLFEDLYLKQGLDQTLDDMLGAMGEMGGTEFNLHEMIPHGFAATINGYAYTTGSIKMDTAAFVSILKIYANIYKFFSHPMFDWDGKVLPRYQGLIDHWNEVDLSSATDEVLLRGIREMAAADSAYWFGSALKLGLSRLMDPLFDKLLKSFLFKNALPAPQPGSASFLRGFSSKALDAQADMEQLADDIRASTDLRELVVATPAGHLLDALRIHPDGAKVVEEINRYLVAYGHQIYNLDFVDPTQNEDPLPVLLSLKALVENPPLKPVRVRQAQMAAERDLLVAQTKKNLNPILRPLFSWVWKWTKYYGPYREHVMFYMGLAWPSLRKLAAELGQRLTTAGAIGAPEDIFYLDSAEIQQAIDAHTTGRPVPVFTQQAEERRVLRAARQRLNPAPKVPERSSLKVGPFDLTMFDPTPTDAGSAGPVLSGYAVSTGRVTAPASVIHSLEDFSQMRPNTVLVCTTTTPAWTPLFSQAVGLVTDVGGALAHGSIVAREYGIPAVMGTGVATERIKSGAMLAIDGDAGTVTLLDEVDEHALDQIEAAEPTFFERHKTGLLAAGAATLIGLWWWRRRRLK